MVFKRVQKTLQPKWYKNKFSQLRDQRDYFHLKFKILKIIKYIYRNEQAYQLSSCKMNYFDEAIQSGKKRIWTHLKDINSECKSSIKCVEINGQKIENTKQICECLNNHDSRKTNITDRKFNASSPKVAGLMTRLVLTHFHIHVFSLIKFLPNF